MTIDSRTRWFALYTLTLASLMIVLDATIVNVALPSIRQDLDFSQTSLAWVVNAYLLALRLLPASEGSAAGTRLDVGGAVTVTAALMLAVYAIVNGNQSGWTSAQTLGLLGGSAALFAVFLWIETHVASPLVPLELFR